MICRGIRHKTSRLFPADAALIRRIMPAKGMWLQQISRFINARTITDFLGKKEERSVPVYLAGPGVQTGQPRRPIL